MNIIGGLTGRVVLDCEHCDDAHARCIDENGALCCSLCPLKMGLDSIRLSDVPALLAWTRKFVNLHPEHPWHRSLSELIGRHPKETK